ncbi:hypothetical protein LCGC14_2055190 [marine sediment metagenome]|uniref:Tyr recombinase domain-containing protein n=1 Tax=marine sediment metagenome TaxID=412755 RepID=A0A0F9EMY0_9ZZZZ
MSNAKPPKTLDVEQQEQLLKALLNKSSPTKTKRKGVRNYLIACLMLDAGLRVGEVVKLKLSHLYFNSVPVNTIVLTPSITKNHKERTIPVNARLAESIRGFFQYWVSDGFSDPAFFVFRSAKNCTPISTRQIENIINAAALKCFGRRINPHMLRHTFASRLMRVTSMRIVQVMLGHTCITSTQIYTHPNEDDKKAAIEKINHNGI